MKNKFKSAHERPEIIIDCKDRIFHDLLFKAVREEGNPGQFGLKSVKGELLTAMEKGRTVILHNLDKAKGAIDVLSEIAMLANGEIDTLTIRDSFNTMGPIQLHKSAIKGFKLKATVSDPNAISTSLRTRMAGNIEVLKSKQASREPSAPK